MRKTIEEKQNVESIVCDKCGLPINYEELNNGAYTVGGIGIDWSKLGAIKIMEKDVYEFDLHRQCLADIVLQKAKPEELLNAKPEIFPADVRPVKEPNDIG